MRTNFINGLMFGAGILMVAVVGIAVAFAADILTVDKDGTVRLRVSDTGKVTLNTSDAAEGDLRFTSRTADPTAPLAGDLWYHAADGTLKLKTGTEILNVPGKFVRYSLTKTDGNFTTSSTSWVDVTGLQVAFTTDFPNQAVLLSAIVRGQSNTANTGNRIDLLLDGVSLSGNATWGLAGSTSAIANASQNLSCSHLTVVSTTGSHTLTVRTFANSGATNTIWGDTGAPAVLQVLKFY